uniref:MULE transposase domain-containing protein n=1 Tax=Caenorhabditis japonica TaxID=281687 RepID=A0A8R1ID43_CAEJA
MASAKRTSGRFVVVRDHHAHDPNSGLASSKLAKLDIKNNAMSTNLTPRELLFDAKTKFGSIPVDMAGSLDALNRMIYRTRTKNASDVNNANMIDPIFTGEMRETNDLEGAQQKAIKDSFPSINEHFCLFHVTQAWRRKLEKLGIYRDTFFGKELYEFWTLLKSMPFVPLADVGKTFEEVVNLLPIMKTPKQKQFEEYLRTYYFGPRPNLSFPPQLWNVVESSIRHLPRTNNSVEASHRNLDVSKTDGVFFKYFFF